MTAGEVGLLAIDDGLLAHMTQPLKRLLLPRSALPCDPGDTSPQAQRHRIAALIRRAIGFHILLSRVRKKV